MCIYNAHYNDHTRCRDEEEAAHIIPALRRACSWPSKARPVISACEKKKGFFPSHIIIIIYIYNNSMLLDDCSRLFVCAGLVRSSI